MRFVTDLSKGILGKPDSFDMWKMVLNHIPDEVLQQKNVKILCLAVGHGSEADVLVQRMISLGKTIEEIKDSIYVLDKYSVFTKDALRKGYTNIIQADFKEWNSSMKFDVVISNPPYQDSNKTEKGGTTLWSVFVKKTINELVKENGYVAFVTPNAWLGFGKTGQPIKPYQLHVVYTDIARYFPGVGSTFTAWVLEKKEVYKETDFPDESVSLDIRNYDSLPVGRPLKGLTIIDKVMGKNLPLLEPKIEKNLKGGWSRNQNTFVNGCDGSLTKTDEYKYEVFHVNSMNFFVKDKPTDYNTPKIITSVTSPNPKLYTKPIGCAAGDLRCYITVNDATEGNQILSYLNSKLYRFVWRRPGMISWTSLAMPKLENKMWTDQDLYDYFNLSPDEIQMVEEYKL